MHNHSLKRLDAINYLIAATVAVIVAFSYLNEPRSYPDQQKLHDGILAHTAGSPYCYRVLTPYLTQQLIELQPASRPPRARFQTAYQSYHYAALLAFFITCYLLFRVWYHPTVSLLGVLFAAAAIPLTFTNHFFQPWSTLEAFLFALSYLALCRKKYWLLPVILPLAALNKETAFFILVAFCFHSYFDLRKSPLGDWVKKPLVLWLLAAAAVWLAVFAGLRLAIGNVEHVKTLQQNWGKNVEPGNLGKSVFYLLLILGPFWYLAAVNFRRAPAFLKELLGMILCYLAAIACYGVWFEVRLLLPVYPLLIALGLQTFQDCFHTAAAAETKSKGRT